MKLAKHTEDATQAFEAVSHKVGLVLVVLGMMHFFNLFVFSRIRANKQIAEAPRPVAPDAMVQADGTLAAINKLGDPPKE